MFISVPNIQKVFYRFSASDADLILQESPTSVLELFMKYEEDENVLMRIRIRICTIFFLSNSYQFLHGVLHGERKHQTEKLWFCFNILPGIK